MSKFLNESFTKRAERKREMSAGIQTRYYRAPEAILTENHYDTAIDIWSLGLVFVELIQKVN